MRKGKDSVYWGQEEDLRPTSAVQASQKTGPVGVAGGF